MKTTYTPEFSKILAEIDCTLALSTYQKGTVILISSPNGKNIFQYAKKYKRPMGLAYKEDGRLVVACKNTVQVVENHRKLAINFPQEPRKYDGLFFPRATFYTGQLDLHDIEWDGENILAVNTAFSCLCKVGSKKSFEVVWQPSFITELVPEDRCHLNGFTKSGNNTYVTLFSSTNVKHGWRETKLESGMLMHAETEEVLVDNIPMPHSPRLFDNKLFYLASAVGEVRYYDLELKESILLATVDGFLRGMTIFRNYIFVGVSTIRESSKSFENLPVSGKAKHAGVVILDIDSGNTVAEFYYEEGITELFDLVLIPGVKRGAILNKDGDIHTRGVNINKDLCFWKKEDKSNKSRES